MFQLLSGIEYCHRNRIIHRDLTSSNILIDKNGYYYQYLDNIKIADFGLARSYGITVKPYTPGMVTIYYRAPEILLGMQEYSASSDIWSIACIFAEIVIKRILFKGDSDIDQLLRIFMTFGTPN